MRGHDSLRERTASESEVLEWLRADYRLRVAFDPEVGGAAPLTPQTTISEWRLACDLIGTRKLAAGMNRWFGCRLPVDEWRAALEPEHVRTLGDLARFAAPHMRLADCIPFDLAGDRDAASGAFFALRALLEQGGQDVVELRPSTMITKLTERQVIALGFAVARLAPALTPEPRVIPTRRQRIGTMIVVLGFAAVVGAVVRVSPALAWTGGAAVLVGILMGRGRPERIEFGGFTTLADLAKAIVSTRQGAA